jgi:tetratricopeptide (TPR) repeat protein
MKRFSRFFVVIGLFGTCVPGSSNARVCEVVVASTPDSQLPTSKTVESGRSRRLSWELGVGSWELTQQPPAAGSSVRELQLAIKKEPANAELHVRLGIAYWQQDDFSRALAAFQRAVKIAPRSAEAQNWLGVALLAQSDFPGGIAALRKAIALDPKHGRAYSNLGSALAKSGDFDEAVKVFERALALEPNSLGAQMNLAMTLRDKGDLEKALEYMRRVVSSDRENANTHYELGQTLRQSGDLDGAVAALEKAIEIDPELREGYYALGMTLKQQGAAARKTVPPSSGPADDLYKRAQDAAGRGEWKAAREHLTAAVALDAQHADAQSLLGFVLGQQGELPSALKYLERAVSLRPESSDARYNLGVALWYSGSRDRALGALRESVTLDPAAGPTYAFLGMALREMSDFAGAGANLQRAIALMPPTAAVYVDLGITFLRMGKPWHALGQFEAGLNAPPAPAPVPNWDAAVDGLRRTLDVGSDRGQTGVRPGSDQGQTTDLRAQAHNVLGLLLGRKGTDANAVAAQFREAVRLRPDFAEAHNNLGLVLIQGGDDEAGIAALRQAVKIRPDYADAHANLGAALTPTDAEEAVRELEKAVALAPTSVKAQFNLAVAYGASPSRGLTKEIEQLRRVIALDPTFARAHLALGKALLRDGTIADAVTELQEAARLEPKSGEAHYQLGLALARAGRKEEAAAELQKGRELVAADDRTQNANLDIAEGRLSLDKGDFDQATAKFRRAIQALPDSSEAHRHLAIALEKRGDASAATSAYRKAVELNPADMASKEALKRLETPAASPSTAASAKVDSVDDPAVVAEVERYIREEKFVEAEPRLTEYLKQRPDSAWGWYALGYSLFAQKKIGESIKALAKSLVLDIRNAEAHKILGRNLMIIGRFDAAQTEFEQGIRYKPDSAELHYNLGKLFSIQDNWEPARKALEQAVRLDASYLEAIDALGLALESLGDDAAAVAKYEQAIALNEKQGGRFASAHVNLSAYYNRTADAERALEYARKAQELDPDSDRAWFQEGKAHERQGNLEKAAFALNRALTLNPRASTYYYVLAGVYRKLGWMDEHRKALEEFKRLEKESTELDKKRRGGTVEPAAMGSGSRRE